MRLNQSSDFALRILMLLGEQDTPITVDEISDRLKLVKSHTMKIVAKLTKTKILLSHRGRAGGIYLARPPHEIKVGDVIRIMENDLAIVECMQDKKSKCVFVNRCKLQGVMQNAQNAFMQVLDNATLQEILPAVHKTDCV